MNYLPYFIGLVLGIIFALLPGMHTNTIISMFYSFNFEKEFLGLFVVGIYPAHLVFSFISSIFMKIPDENNALASISAQKLLDNKKGIIALKTAILSCVFSGIFSALFFNFALNLFPSIYSFIQPNIKYLLIIFSTALILKSQNKITAFIVFVCAGLLGQISFSLNLVDPFLPLFGGFFAIASAISIYQNKKKQNDVENNKMISNHIDESSSLTSSQIKNILFFSFFGVVLGFLADLLPGIGAPSQIASFISIVIPFTSLSYLSLTSSLSISQFIFSLASQISIDKARVGATEWLSKFIKIEQNSFLLLLLIVLSLTLCALILLLLIKKFRNFSNLDFSKFSPFIVLYLAILVYLLDGPFGIFVLILSSALGYLTLKTDVERTHLMGAIIIPTLLLLFRVFL